MSLNSNCKHHWNSFIHKESSSISCSHTVCHTHSKPFSPSVSGKGMWKPKWTILVGRNPSLILHIVPNIVCVLNSFLEILSVSKTGHITAASCERVILSKLFRPAWSSYLSFCAILHNSVKNAGNVCKARYATTDYKGKPFSSRLWWYVSTLSGNADLRNFKINLDCHKLVSSVCFRNMRHTQNWVNIKM